MDSNDVIETLFLSSARGAKAAPLTISVERELTRDDIAQVVAEPPDLAATTPRIKKLRQSHHMLAKLLAQGVKHVEAGAITGYSSSRISILLHDPAFQECVAYYKAQVNGTYLDVHARLAAVGMDAIDSLHEKLEEGKLTANQELALAEMAMDRSGLVVPPGRSGGASPPGGGVTVNLKFVAPQSLAHSGGGPVIDAMSTPVPLEKE